MPEHPVLIVQVDASVALELLDTAAAAVESGELTAEEAAKTLADFVTFSLVELS